MGFPSGGNGKESTCNAGDVSSTPGSGRSPGEGNGHPFQYSHLENSINREVWQATESSRLLGSHKELDMTEHTNTLND